jgi:hypothetical protein
MHARSFPDLSLLVWQANAADEALIFLLGSDKVGFVWQCCAVLIFQSGGVFG